MRILLIGCFAIVGLSACGGEEEPVRHVWECAEPYAEHDCVADSEVAALFRKNPAGACAPLFESQHPVECVCAECPITGWGCFLDFGTYAGPVCSSDETDPAR